MALVKRADKKLFMKLADATGEVGTRLRYFTSLEGSKNPKEYTRQYIDESFEQSDVTGYSPSLAFGFDEHTDDPVLAELVKIIDAESIGNGAVKSFYQVDFSKPIEAGKFPAIKRDYTIIADTDGSGTDAYTYAGNLKVKGQRIVGTAAITTPSDGDAESVDTITFTPATA